MTWVLTWHAIESWLAGLPPEWAAGGYLGAGFLALWRVVKWIGARKALAILRASARIVLEIEEEKRMSEEPGGKFGPLRTEATDSERQLQKAYWRETEEARAQRDAERARNEALEAEAQRLLAETARKDAELAELRAKLEAKDTELIEEKHDHAIERMQLRAQYENELEQLGERWQGILNDERAKRRQPIAPAPLRVPVDDVSAADEDLPPTPRPRALPPLAPTLRPKGPGGKP